jgi:hypothetical protein
MGFLRRLFGDTAPGSGDTASDADRPPAGTRGPDTPGTASVADEQAREREVLRDEARRLDDELLQRQLRYADRSWTPPAQGGSRRADDAEADTDRS